MVLENEYDYDNGGYNLVERTLSDAEAKAVNDFKALILRFERVVNGMNSCGDGTAETEAQAAEQAKTDSAGLEKIIETITKKVIKPVQKQDNSININDVLSFSYHGHFWIVTEIWNNSKGVSCATYELLGSEKRGYQRLHGTSAKRFYQTISRLEKEMLEGKTKVYTLQEVEETTEVEKWVRKSQQKQTKKPKENTNTETAEKAQNELEYDIKQDIDTRDNSTIYVVKIIKTLSKDEYIEANKYMRFLGGYYSKFKNGFIFKDDPTNKLNCNSVEAEAQEEAETEQPQEEIFQPVIIGGYEIRQDINENKKVFVAKIIKTVSKDEYVKINKYMQSLGATYNKYLHGFVFTDNPIELLQTESAA
jgi:hypothetical protein